MDVGEAGAALDDENVIDLSVCRVVAGNRISNETKGPGLWAALKIKPPSDEACSVRDIGRGYHRIAPAYVHCPL